MPGGLGGGGFGFDDMMLGSSRESSPEYESADDGEHILAQAVRTRLPRSLSPDKERSPEPEYFAAQPYPTGAPGVTREDGEPAVQRRNERERENCKSSGPSGEPRLAD